MITYITLRFVLSSILDKTFVGRDYMSKTTDV